MLFGRMGRGFGRVGIVPVSTGYSFVNAEAATYVAAMDVPPLDAEKAIIDTFVGALKTAGIWAKLDLLFLLAAHTEQASLLNVKQEVTDSNLSEVGSLTFAVNTGWTGAGANGNRLETALWSFDEGPNYALDSAHAGVWSLTTGQENALVGFGNAISNGLLLLPRSTGNALTFKVNHNATQTAVGSQTDGSGHYIINRSASNAEQVYRNGASIGSSSVTSGAVTSQVFRLLGDVGGGASSRQIAAAHAGGSLSADEASDFYDALSAYLGAIGAI